jgi:GDSL-like Lipase/Acylhydrolase
MKTNDPSPNSPGKTSLSMTAITLSLIGLVSCSSGTPTPPGCVCPVTQPNIDFTTTVFLGDSLTAGSQNDALLDTTQVNGWAPLLAKQASFTITQPLIAYPGAPNTLVLQSYNPLVITTAGGKTTGRDNPTTQPTDFAVPGALLNDVANTIPLANPVTAEDQYTQLVLGYPGLSLGQAYSQAASAVAAKPSAIFLWIGNNDGLLADISGDPASMTSTADFTTQYTALINQLSTKTSAHLIIGNVIDITFSPYLTPAAEVLASYSSSTGQSITTLSTLFGITTGDYVTPDALPEIDAILAGTQTTPLSGDVVLTAAEVATAKTQVAAYNSVIATQASAVGATVVDTNAIFNNLAANGVTINGYKATNAFLGGFFSLDGVHPTNTGYAVITNTFIDAINAAFNSKIPDVNLTTIAAADPLWPPNLPASTATKLPAALKLKALQAVRLKLK